MGHASNQLRGTDAKYSRKSLGNASKRFWQQGKHVITLEKRLCDGAAYGHEHSVKPSLLNLSREAVSSLAAESGAH